MVATTFVIQLLNHAIVCKCVDAFFIDRRTMRKLVLMRQHLFLQLRSMDYLPVAVVDTIFPVLLLEDFNQDHLQTTLHTQDHKWGITIIPDLPREIPSIQVHPMEIPSLNRVNSGLKYPQALQGAWVDPQGAWVEGTRLLQAITHHK